MDLDLRKRIEAIAYRLSNPFCYGCYAVAPSGKCLKCYSDDLMRELPGIGVEWGIDWVITELIKADLYAIDTDEAFEESLDGAYPETTTVGFMELDTITAMKRCDPVMFEMAQGEWIDSEEKDDQIVSFDNGSTYYWIHDLENWVDNKEREIEEKEAGNVA